TCACRDRQDAAPCWSRCRQLHHHRAESTFHQVARLAWPYSIQKRFTSLSLWSPTLHRGHLRTSESSLCFAHHRNCRLVLRPPLRWCGFKNLYMAKQLSRRLPMQAAPMLLRDWIDRAARRDPGKPWIVLADGGQTVTYGELRHAVSRIAAFLHGRGLSANDR